MKIEFTKGDLDYLAAKIAEYVQSSNDTLVDESAAGMQIKDIFMSARLYNLFRKINFDKRTLREVATVDKYQWKENVFGFGDQCVKELEVLLKSAGLDFGDSLLRRNGIGELAIVSKDSHI